MSGTTRRDALKSLATGALALGAAGLPLAACAQPNAADAPALQPPYTLPPLGYAVTALDPHIDAQTMEIHHGRHHQAYVTNLNAALAGGAEWARQPLDVLLRDLTKVPEPQRAAVRNNGGGHVNHTQFWTLIAPGASLTPSGAIADAITSNFTDLTRFKELFSQAAMTRFGSGWAWLSDDAGKLVIHSTANQDTPSMEGKRAIFGVDVWEHAYYLKYQNRRADYLTAIWNVINWQEVNRRLRA